MFLFFILFHTIKFNKNYKRTSLVLVMNCRRVVSRCNLKTISWRLIHHLSFAFHCVFVRASQLLMSLYFIRLHFAIEMRRRPTAKSCNWINVMCRCVYSMFQWLNGLLLDCWMCPVCGVFVFNFGTGLLLHWHQSELISYCCIVEKLLNNK